MAIAIENDTILLKTDVNTLTNKAINVEFSYNRINTMTAKRRKQVLHLIVAKLDCPTKEELMEALKG